MQWMRTYASHIILLAALFAFILPNVAMAHGDRVIPQVADGPGIRTKFDITNLSPEVRISKVKLLFFRQDGTPWSVPTNQGTVTEVSLQLGRFQTIRIETLGTSSAVTSGYAILRNSEQTAIYSEDYEVNISVFYEVLSGSSVIDTVSVSTGQPTTVWVFPAEIDATKDLYTGFAIVNLSNNVATVSMRLWTATANPENDATDGGQVTITLRGREQQARFLNESGLFSSKSTFRGMLIGASDQPVAILALLQTSVPNGVQYATLVPAYADALRKNTYAYLRQGFPLDADIPIVDYFGNSDDTTPWDLLYERQSNTARRLVPRSGATAAVIGTRTDQEFDAVTIDDLKAFTYSTSNIDMSDASVNLAQRFSFAIRTGLGRYVKCRISEVITRESTDSAGARVTNKDLALEIFIFK